MCINAGCEHLHSIKNKLSDNLEQKWHLSCLTILKTCHYFLPIRLKCTQAIQANHSTANR